MSIDTPRLLHGPYLAPRCKVGGLKCRLRGRVKVVAMADGRTPWPKTRKSI